MFICIDIVPTTPRPTTISTVPPTTTAPPTKKVIDNPLGETKEENTTESSTMSNVQGFQAPDNGNGGSEDGSK